MYTSALLRREQKKYAENRRKRVLSVRCPRVGCKAKPGEPCKGTTGWPIKGTHVARHNEAKRLGVLQGRWFDEKKWGFYY